MKALLVSLEDAVKAGKPLPIVEPLPGALRRLRACVAGEPIAAAAPAARQPAIATPANGLDEAREGDAAAQAAAFPAAVSASGTAEATVKVSTSRLDRLIDNIGELVIAQSMVSMDLATVAAGNQRAARNLAHLGKITRELQDLSMSMRMVPIQGTFQKMSRLVRDLSRKANKDIELHIEGGETELDRNVVDAIGDPLVHMVRNAADHGVEGPDARVKAGKPRVGNITLRAYHQAGTILIEIEDDGRGLRKDKILKKAIDAGIIRPDEPLTEQQIFNLIFHAGLSTADKITDISGRGVGMDVVRKNVESLRGRIDIASREGQGTTFTIRLPLTLAVIDGLIIRVGTQRYILPITSVEQSIQPKKHQISTVLNRDEMVLVRDRLLPLVRLHKLFDVKPRTEDPSEALIVIVQDDARRCCLLVDELVGQQQVVIKSLGGDLGQVPGVSGGAILGDGNVSLILDVPGLIDLSMKPTDAAGGPNHLAA